MTPVPELNDLVDTVGDRCPTGTELDKLRAASEVAKEVGRLGEDLVTHFVDEARTAGASWADIGDVLGVSRQGAHQRHHDRPAPDRWWRADLGRFSPGARQALKNAAHEAKAAGNGFLGSEHILLGVLAVPDNVGSKALQRCNIDLAALEAATRARLVPAGQQPEESIAGPLAGPFGGRGTGGRGGRGRRGGPGFGPPGFGPPDGGFAPPDGAPTGFGPAGAGPADAPGAGTGFGPPSAEDAWGRGRGRGRGGPGGRRGGGAYDVSDGGGDADGRGRGRGWRSPFTVSGRRMFDLTIGAALELRHDSIGCEHMVMALTRGQGIAAEVLHEAGATDAAVTDAVIALCTEIQA